MRRLLGMRLRLVAKGFLVVITVCLGINLGLLLLVRSAFDDVLVASARRAEALAFVGDLQAQSSLMRAAIAGFVRTQDPHLLSVYFDMLAVREGAKAPPDVDSPVVYWAWALSGQKLALPSPRVSAVPWTQRAEQLQLDARERAAMAEVGAAFEGLRQIERVAFAAAQGMYDSEKGEFVNESRVDAEYAAERVTSPEYESRNAQLLAALGDFRQAVQASSAMRTERAQARVTSVLGVAVAINLLLVPLLGLSVWASRNTLFRPLAKLEAAARRLSQGQYGAWVPRPERIMHEELRTLGAALNKMGLAVARDLEQRELTARELRLAKTAAEDAARSRSMFLANMSHEIRTPLNAVLGMTQLALQTNLSAQQRDYLQKSLGAGTSLLGVLNDVLDFSKIEAGKLEIEKVEFELVEVVDESLLLVRQRAREKDLELICEFAQRPPLSAIGRLRGDRLRIGQALTNLLSNAVKFTDKGHVLLRVLVEPGVSDDAGILRIEVRDTGIGMSRGQINRLFAEFTQVDGSTTRRFGGTGLGLSIVKRLTSLMGGEVFADSVPGKGSTFTLTIPVGIVAAEPAEAAADLGSARILVMDECAPARQAVISTLGALGVGHGRGTREATDGAHALSLAAAAAESLQPFDLLVMGLGSDAEASADLLAKLHAKLPQAEALLLSRDAEPGAVRCPLGLRYLALAKPVTPSALRDALLQLATPVPAVKAPPARPEPETDLSGLRVLLVEDNSLNQEIASALLTRAGAQVELADNGLQALQRLEALGPTAFDVVLMDLQMPAMDGHEATQRLRRMRGFEELPVIALTAHAFQQERDRCLAVGMSAHLVKPLVPRELYQALLPLAVEKRKHLEIAAPLPADVFGFELGPGELPGPVPSTSPETPVPAWLADVPQLNARDALMHAGGDLRLLERTLGSFMRHLRGLVTFGPEDIERMGWGERRRRVHTLRGLAGTVGARGMERLAARLETIAAQERTLAWRTESAELALLLAETLNSLEKALSAPRETVSTALVGPVDSADHARVRAVLAERTGDRPLAPAPSATPLHAPLSSRLSVRNLSEIRPSVLHVLSLNGFSLEEDAAAPTAQELSAEIGLRVVRTLRALAGEYDGRLLGLWPQLSDSLLSWLPGGAAAELDNAMTQCQFGRASVLLKQLDEALAQVCDERAAIAGFKSSAGLPLP